MNPSLSVSSLAIALLAASSAPAFAQDSGSWGGLHVGGHLGNVLKPGGHGRIDFDTNLDGNFGDTVRTGTGANAFSTGFCSACAPRAAPPRPPIRSCWSTPTAPTSVAATTTSISTVFA